MGLITGIWGATDREVVIWGAVDRAMEPVVTPASPRPPPLRMLRATLLRNIWGKLRRLFPARLTSARVSSELVHEPLLPFNEDGRGKLATTSERVEK